MGEVAARTRRRRQWIFWITLIGLLLALVMPVIADTGGSMGGGDWGGDSDSSSSSSSSGGGWSSSDSDSGWSSDNDSSGGGGGGCNDSSAPRSSGSNDNGSTAAIIVLVVLMVIFYFIVSTLLSTNKSAPSEVRMQPDADITVLRIAIDGRARKFVQKELARIASTTATGTQQGRVELLREVAMLLRKLRDAWVYGGAVNEPMRALRDAKPVFDRYVDAARSKFQEETIRNEQGVAQTRAPSEYTPRSDEGEGLILVSIIIAAREELFTVARIGNGDQLRVALESACNLLPNVLVALEVVWQPSSDSDRLSSMELEAKYPQPDLFPLVGALVGKVFCLYCSGPFPAELVSCPHCGAPAPGRTRDAA